MSRPGQGGGRFGPILAALLVLALVLRIAWPLADPPVGMSWSGGPYTDPPSNALAARYEVEGGPGRAVDVPERFVYPGLHFLARLAYGALGPRRLSTVVLAAALGTATVGLLALALRRGPGRGAAILGALLAASSAWLVPHARILMAEGVAIALLTAASVAAMGRGAGAAIAAGALAATAGLAGKYFALAYLPALLLFLAVRGGGRTAGAAMVGAAAVGAAWALVVFRPHQAEILEWLHSSSPGRAAGAPKPLLEIVLAPFAALRDSWLAPRQPLVLPLAAWFLATTFAARETWRRRADDGSLLFALWGVVVFFALAWLPYRAPRYFTLVAVPLVACAAGQIGAHLAGVGRSPRVPPLGLIPLFVWLVVVLFAAIDVVERLEAWIVERFFLEAWWRAPQAAPTLSRLHETIGSLPRHVAAAVLLAAALTAIRRMVAARATLSIPARAGPVLLALVVLWDAISWTRWALDRSTTIEDAKRSLAAVVAPDAVILGAYAPLLTEGSRLVALPLFSAFTAAEFQRIPRPTHLLLVPSAGTAVEEAVPGLLDEAPLVQVWPIRTAWARSVLLFRLPPPFLPATYRETDFERAADALRAGDADATLGILEARSRPPEREDVPDFLALEAVARQARGETERAAELWAEVVRRQPRDPMARRNLAAIRLAEGNAGAARDLLRGALAADPADGETAAMLLQILEAPASSGAEREAPGPPGSGG